MSAPESCTAQNCEPRRDRLVRKLSAARANQLKLALAGRVVESAKYAARAALIRSALSTAVSSATIGAGACMALAPSVAIAQPATVRTVEVTEDQVQEHRRVTGSLQAVSRSAIASQEAGLIEAVRVDEGSTVRAGDVIARLDMRRLKAQIEEARADRANSQAIVSQREAELSYARLDRDRVAKAARDGAASERELTEAETTLGVREAQLESAQRLVDSIARRIDLLEIRLEDMTVVAPFDARVVSRHVEPGEWIEPGSPIVTLVSTGQIEARLEVPERFAPSLQSGDIELYVQVNADGRSVPSVEVRPVLDVDPRARTFQVFVTLDNASGELTPGMSVSAWVPTTDRQSALLAPKDAVIRDGRDAYVYRVDGSDSPHAERTPVTVLFSHNDRLALAPGNGLSAGDVVVIEGNERLMPGMPVVVASLGVAPAK